MGFRGSASIRERALRILSNPDRTFYYSPFLRLEVMLQASHEKSQLEIEFYNTYFASATCFGNLDRIFEIGEREARKHGIPVMDAMHIAAANLSRCEVLVTGEKPTKPMYRTRLVTVVRFYDLNW